MIVLSNESSQEVAVAIAFRDTRDGTWVSRGWWTIPAYEDRALFEPGPEMQDFHYTAHCLGSESIQYMQKPGPRFRTRTDVFEIRKADRRLSPEDVAFEPFVPGRLHLQPVEMARAEAALQDMVGLDTVKALVAKRKLWMELQIKRRLLNINVPPIRLHLAFKGKPGTGKTSVARIFGDIYKGLGLLRKGHVVEVDGRGLIASFVGQTAQKTNDLVEAALDGVLFVDEAYALHQRDTPQDFGREAVATLMKAMEDHRDRLAVILAGYPHDIEDLLNSNRGLRSRVSTEIGFPDFTPDELLQILERLVASVEGSLSPECRETALGIFARLASEDDHAFGNARLVETLFQEMDEQRAMRVFDEALDLVSEPYQVCDIPEAYRNAPPPLMKSVSNDAS